MTESTPRSRTSARPTTVAPARGLVLLLFLGVVVLALVGATATLLGPGAPWSSGHAATDRRTGPAAAEPGSSDAAGPAGAGPDGLDPELVRRFEEARAAAAAEGVELRITSGWRSAAEQQELVERALERYGSAEEARRWVLPPESSEHVAGEAVDVGPTEGAYWLQQHGARFGLCQTYANEVWHYEAATDPGGTCPPQHPDASHGW